MDISKLLRKRFDPNNLETVLIKFKRIINKEISDSNYYREKNNFRITYFFHEDFIEMNDLLFLSQCISSNDNKTGNMISNILSFEKEESMLILNNHIWKL